ncbi:MAG: 5-formyltetrahydrofolate cyclo-ligase [Pseudomonadota bacterium]
MSDDAKTAARKAAFARRKAAFDAGLASHGAARLKAVLADYRGRVVAGYMPIRTEIDPLTAMAAHAAHSPVVVPVIVAEGQPLAFHRWSPGTEMKAGPFGAQIPALAEPLKPSVLIVPLVAFDRRGGRLGYGGGFYDRTLERLRKSGPITAIGFAFAAQEAETLPLETTDQPLDMVVTERDTLILSALGA